MSILVPVFNAQATIDRAIQSCLSQTMPDLEVVVVDDASSDASRDVVAGIDDPRVKLVSLTENVGPGGARNRGLEVSSGPWLTVMDADDAYLPTRLERLLDLASSLDDPTCVIMDRSSVVDGTTGRILNSRDHGPPPRASRTLTPVEAIRSRVGGKPFFSQHLLKKSGARYPTGVRFGEDTAFLVQLLNAKGARLAKSPERLYLYTYRPDSLTGATDRIEHLDRSYQFLVNECALTKELLAEVKRLQQQLELDRKWDSARSALRSREYGMLLGEVVRSPSLVLRAVRGYGRHRRFQAALKNARLGGTSLEATDGDS